ncbi:MAG: hypothetical protein K9L68_08065 [Spirochaetales bacterium]|nr:hypothetical protein [Spirochaetales bacterium]MCF7938538.1 hypothetical protein [Spirochaetales bacterium]
MNLRGFLSRYVRPAAAAGFLLLTLQAVGAYDFAERPASVVLSPAPDGFSIGESGFAQSALRSNVFRNTEMNRFQIENYLHHNLLDLGRFRSSLYYAAVMLNSPVTEGFEPSAEAAPWIMNAFQFEYGLVFAYDLFPGKPRFVFLAEYGRRSYHPLRSGLDEPAADILRTGFGIRNYRLSFLPNVTLDGLVRLGWSDLYDFWGAENLPKPRGLYTIYTAFEAAAATPLDWLSAFFLIMPDFIYLREGGFSADLTVQTGLRFGSSPGLIELFFDLYHTGNSERFSDRKDPLTLAGYGLRFVLES